MRPPRSRRVVAQRKFAQGAFVPNNVAVVLPNNAVTAAPAPVEIRREAQEPRNVAINLTSPMTAATLLDVVSFQGLHTHSHPVVLVERLRGRSLSRDSPQQTVDRRQRQKKIRTTCLKKPRLVVRKKKEYKRMHVMSLRSRRLSKLELKKIDAAKRTIRQVATKLKVPEPEKVPKAKKKKNGPLELNDFSLDDNRPLTYFAKCSSTPKRPAAPMPPVAPVTPAAPIPQAAPMPPRAPIPEPVAGPSGLQRKLPDRTPAMSIATSTTARSSYYSETNIHRWMNESESRRTDEAEEQDVLLAAPCPACPAEQWRSVQDVINAPKHELDSRCSVCRPCQRISKLIKLSTLLKTQVKFDLTGMDSEPLQKNIALHTENVAMVSPEADHGHLYLDLLPKHPSIMMKLRIHVMHGKELLSACLIPRSDARKNKQEFLLQEQEHLLDQLIETLILSLNDTSNIKKDASAAKKRIKRQKTGEISVFESWEMQAARAEKEAEVSRIEAERQAELSRIEAERQAKLSRLQAEKRAELSRVEAERRAELSRVEAEVRAMVSADVKAEDCKIDDIDEQAKPNAPVCKHVPPIVSPTPEGGTLVEAPVLRPTKEEFNDPIAYFEKIWPEAYKYGICKVVPPPDWKPKCRVHDDIRFDVTNQYISRLFSRWGPAARELCAIKLCLQQQKVNFARPPVLDGVEVNLPKLYHLVQRHGGLETVINKKRWGKVAEEMKFNKTPNTERKLDQIYVKYLLPYDTLVHQERQEIMRKVEKAWNKKNQKLLDRALNPLHRQKRMLGLSDSSDDETEDEDTAIALNEAEDCIIQGAYMNRAKFKRVATNAYENIFGQGSEANEPPSIAVIEEQYWKHVLLGTEHLCVHTAAIDTGEEGHGFTKNKNEPFGKHPWNLKMFLQHPRNILRYLGPVLGMTVPTLHLGMLFSTSCWHKDPHALPWMEFQHIGPTRIWYGIQNEQSDNFRKAVETLCPTSCQNKGLWLPSEIAMIPPHILREHNVSLSRTTQERGEFILAFPKAYTCCISTGYTESESVYFAPPSWLENLPHVFLEARESCEPTMFSMEHLLLLMCKDQRTEKTLLQMVQPIYDKMLRDEVNNRQMLQEKGLKFIHETTSRKRPAAWNVREQECEYCRATLFLSKVQGLTGKKSSLCLEHALKLLDTNKYKHKSLAQLEVFVYVSVKELNAVGEDMKRRLATAAT